MAGSEAGHGKYGTRNKRSAGAFPTAPALERVLNFVSPTLARVACILNSDAHSSAALGLRQSVQSLFDKHGAAAEVHLCRPGASLSSLASDAVRRGHTIIVAAGGDGTINAVASALIGSGAALGVLPVGTLNHFAKDLGLPLDLEEAVKTILRGHVVRVDVGEVNGHIFLNNSSIGLYPALVREREKTQKRGYKKWTAFARALYYVMRRYSLLHVRLRFEGVEIAEDTPFVFIGNNEYEVRGLNLGARTRLDSGKLSVYRAPNVGRMGLLTLALGALAGTEDLKELEKSDTEVLRISVGKRHLRVATDGEVMKLTGPLLYRISKQALKVIGPSPEPEPAA